MAYPDVCGFTLEKAVQILVKEGCSVEKINILKPPRDITNDYDGSYRVIKADFPKPSKAELLVCKPL